jgi:phosphoglycolate phosphatase
MITIGFDADGVLLDSRQTAWREMERVFACFGSDMAITSPEAMDAAFGDAAHKLVGHAHAPVLRAMHRLLMRHSAPNIRLFDAALAVAEQHDGPRILVTAALADGVTVCLGNHAHLFDEILGFESGRKPDLLARLARRLDLYVTDTAFDVRACQAVGLPTIAVTWGYDARTAIEASCPDAIADTPTELQHIINKFIKRGGSP